MFDKAKETFLDDRRVSISFLLIFVLSGMLTTLLLRRMDNIPSANMRQHKLDQQRKLIEEKQKQKRAMQNKKIELNDLKAGGGGKSRPGSSNKRELHGYDGPLQYLSQGNPDSMTTVQVSPQAPHKPTHFNLQNFQ